MPEGVVGYVGDVLYQPKISADELAERRARARVPGGRALKTKTQMTSLKSLNDEEVQQGDEDIPKS